MPESSAGETVTVTELVPAGTVSVPEDVVEEEDGAWLRNWCERHDTA